MINIPLVNLYSHHSFLCVISLEEQLRELLSAAVIADQLIPSGFQ